MAEANHLTSAEDFLAKLRQGTRETYEIKARGLTLPVRVLSIDETLDIRNRCMAENTKMGGDQANLATLLQKATLMQASTIGGINSLPPKFFNLITLDELTYLFNEWNKINEEVNPSLEILSEDRFKALVTALKKNAMDLKSCSLPEWKAMSVAYLDLIQRMETQS